MSDKLLKDFLIEQKKMMSSATKCQPADKMIIQPDKLTTAAVSEESTEAIYNYIIDKKPAHKKVVKFLQQCIDEILEDDD